jgi:hypothetical protein
MAELGRDFAARALRRRRRLRLRDGHFRKPPPPARLDAGGGRHLTASWWF